MIYPGESYLSIGVKGLDKGDIKVWVNPADIINRDSLVVKFPKEVLLLSKTEVIFKEFKYWNIVSNLGKKHSWKLFRLLSFNLLRILFPVEVSVVLINLERLVLLSIMPKNFGYHTLIIRILWS